LKPSIAVERFTAGDLEGVLAIERASFGRDAWPKKLFLDYFREYPDLFLVARRGKKMAGYTITCVGPRNAELVSIAVDPESRRRGIARALLDYTKVQLKKKRAKTWWLMVDTTNDSAIAFYEQYGFQTTRRVKRYYGAGRDAWRMRLTL
jgi:ribosomal-protein-alanine N-acetyltransferase